jgi:hypothetical protein
VPDKFSGLDRRGQRLPGHVVSLRIQPR